MHAFGKRSAGAGIVALVLLGGVCASCSRETDGVSTTRSERKLLDGVDAPPGVDLIAVAKKAAAEYGKVDVSRLEVSNVGKQGADTWSVTVWRLPATPGGFCDVIIDRQGKVQNIWPGA